MVADTILFFHIIISTPAVGLYMDNGTPTIALSKEILNDQSPHEIQLIAEIAFLFWVVLPYLFLTSLTC